MFEKSQAGPGDGRLSTKCEHVPNLCNIVHEDH